MSPATRLQWWVSTLQRCSTSGWRSLRSTSTTTPLFNDGPWPLRMSWKLTVSEALLITLHTGVSRYVVDTLRSVCVWEREGGRKGGRERIEYECEWVCVCVCVAPATTYVFVLFCILAFFLLQFIGHIFSAWSIKWIIVPPVHFTLSLGFLFCEFDQFWRQKKPENIMSFVPIKTEFVALHEDLLASDSITFSWRLAD